MTFKKIRKDFWDYLKENNPELYAKRVKGEQNEQVCMIREEFRFHIDCLRSDKKITEKQAQNITL